MTSSWNLLNHLNSEAEYTDVLAKKPIAYHLDLFIWWRFFGQMSLFVSVQNVTQMVLLVFE